MKIYISGQVSGLHPDEYLKKFEEAENALREAGVSNIVNPTKLGIHPREEWSAAMTVCLSHLETCTAIYMLRDWTDSFGARRELTRAMEKRMDIFYESANDIHDITRLINAGTV